MAKDTDLAWCAGFFDGEGHVSYRRSYPNKVTNKVSPALMASVPQTADNVNVLKHFQSITGLGRIKGPYKTNTKDICVLSFGVDEIPELFNMIKPYLQEDKTKDFQTAIMHYWSHDTSPTKEDFARQIKHSKKKGCPECGFDWNGLVCSECGYID